MARIGRKILSAFIDVGEDKQEEQAAAAIPGSQQAGQSAGQPAGAPPVQPPVSAAADQRFAGYFDKLFSDTNIPGPDYFEFARMTSAMQAIADERSRYVAAFAGLQVQGLDKEKLLATAGEYLRVLTTDAEHFQTTVEAALQEKVVSRSAEAEEKSRRIQALSQEILELQQQIGVLQKEMAENKEKLMASSSGYTAESERRKQQIQADIGKIKQFIQ
jgi:hypothetical protein